MSDVKRYGPDNWRFWDAVPDGRYVLASDYDALASRLAAAEAAFREAQREQERLSRVLDFYARGCHFDKGDDESWDTVSGEPVNFWCSEAGSTVEDGSIAKLGLEGFSMGDDDDEGMTPPAGHASLHTVGDAALPASTDTQRNEAEGG